MADDILDSTATTATLAVNGNTSSAIDSVGDRDWFRLELTAGTTYTFRQEAVSGSLLDSCLRLFDASGANELAYNDDGGDGHNALITYTPTATATYYLAAGAFSSASSDTSTGGYQVSAAITTPTSTGDNILASTATSATLAVNGSASSTIDSVGDRDWFRINLKAGVTYTFGQNAPTGSSLDSYLRLMNASGSQLASNDDSGGGRNSLITYTVTADATYYLAAGAYGDASIGAYTVYSTAGTTTTTTPTTRDNIPASVESTQTLVVGSSASSTIDSLGDGDWFKIALTAGTTYIFGLFASSGSALDAYLRLLDAKGTLLASDDDAGGNHDALFIYTPTVTSAYFVAASAYGDTSIGGYTVAAAIATPAPTPVPIAPDTILGSNATSATLAVGASASSTIDFSGDRDWFRIELKAGTSYIFDQKSSGSSLDSFLRLMDANGQELANNDDNFSSETKTFDSQLSYTPSVSDIYFLAAGAFREASIGNYTIAARDAASTAPPVAEPTDIPATIETTFKLTVGSTADSKIDSAGDHDWFAISLTAGEHYLFYQTASGVPLLDSYLSLMDPSGTLITSDDDSGSGKYDAMISYDVTVTGIYFLNAGAYNDVLTGDYQLSAEIT